METNILNISVCNWPRDQPVYTAASYTIISR